MDGSGYRLLDPGASAPPAPDIQLEGLVTSETWCAGVVRSRTEQAVLGAYIGSNF